MRPWYSQFWIYPGLQPQRDFSRTNPPRLTSLKIRLHTYVVCYPVPRVVSGAGAILIDSRRTPEQSIPAVSSGSSNAPQFVQIPMHKDGRSRNPTTPDCGHEPKHELSRGVLCLQEPDVSCDVLPTNPLCCLSLGLTSLPPFGSDEPIYPMA